MRSPRPRARTAIVVLVAFLLVQTAASPVVAATGVEAGAHTAASRSTTVTVDETVVANRPVGAGTGPTADHRATSDAVIHGNYTFVRDERPGTVGLRMQYALPDSVTAFRVQLPGLTGSSVSFVDSEGFDRVDETTFEWTRSTSTPTLGIQLAVTTESVTAGDRGIDGDGWTFATAPTTRIDLSYVGARPRYTTTTAVEGIGYAADRMAFLGSYTTADATTDDEEITFVVGNGSSDANLSAARTFLDRARGRFDFGVRRDRLVIFVLPYESRAPGSTRPLVTGEAFGDAFWVTADATTVTGAENAFAHEYVHSRLATVGNGSAAWLTEATAEYYGYLTTLNTGGVSYDGFYRAATAERFLPNRTGVTLSDRETWRGTLGDYEKGAHVLAALDAEIRERTDGEHALYDVFVANRSFDDYEAFRAQVIETTGDESLGPWLDRYVTTDALPPVPDDPALYVHGADLDADGDGLTSGQEIAPAGSTTATNPFVADTDGDGLTDGREREIGTDPTNRDTDGDTLSDAHELDVGTDPTNRDTDGDGTNDAIDAYPTDPSVRTDRSDAESETGVEGERAEGTVTATGSIATDTSAGPSAANTTARGNGTAAENGASADGGVVDRVRSRVETPGFGFLLTAVAIALGGMLFLRENRHS